MRVGLFVPRGVFCGVFPVFFPLSGCLCPRAFVLFPLFCGIVPWLFWPLFVFVGTLAWFGAFASALWCGSIITSPQAVPFYVCVRIWCEYLVSILFLLFVFFIPSVLGVFPMSMFVFWWTLAVNLPFLAFPLVILISFCSLFLLVSSILSLMLAALFLLLTKAILSVVFCSMLPSLCRVSTIFSSQMQQRLM